MSANGKADLQISPFKGRYVPKGDPHNMNVSSDLRPTAVIRGMVHERL
jgi:hypothetical protein